MVLTCSPRRRGEDSSRRATGEGNEEKARNALLKLPKIAEPRNAAPYGFALGEEH